MSDEQYLLEAIEFAKQSKEPLKCASVLVDKNGKVIAKEINSQRADNRTTAHAEIKAVEAANKLIGRKLAGVTAYGNYEPCTMCLTALIFAGVKRIVFAEHFNDALEDSRKISIDCFDFVKHFPYQPTIELIKVSREATSH